LLFGAKLFRVRSVTPKGAEEKGKQMKRFPAAIITTIAMLAVSGSAFATMDIYKELKAKESTVTCQTCHVPKMPKKDAAELNDFGKTVKAAKGADGKVDWSKVRYKAPAAGVAP
jgi:hypothetical protein